MIILFVVAFVTFFVFFNRAGRIGEQRRAFWGISGAAAVIAPATVVGMIVNIIIAIVGHTPDWAPALVSIIGAFCLVAGVFLGKWMLDRFLPLPAHLIEDSDEEIPDDDYD